MRYTARVLFFFCLVFAPCALRAQDGEAEQEIAGQKMLKDGTEAFYNSKYDEAEQLFLACQKLDPENPVCDLRLVQGRVFRWRSTLGDTPKVSPEEFGMFVALINAGLAKSRAKMKNGDHEDFQLFVQSYFYSLLAVMQAKNVSYSAMADSTRIAVKLAERSRYQDAKYIRGFISYKASTIPGSVWHPPISWFYNLKGIPHNRDRGLRLMFEAVAKNSSPFVDDIWFMLFGIYLDPANKDWYTRDERERVYNYLHNKYPGNLSLEKYQNDKQ